MNIAAAYILYFPDRDLLSHSLKAICPQIQGIIAIDNSGGAEDMQHFLEQEGNGKPVFYEYPGRNLGIGAALNLAFRIAEERGFDAVITFDQDSIPPGNMVKDYLEHYNASAVKPGQTGPVYAAGQKSGTADHIITSGAFTTLDIWRKTGPFDESLFIDMVDVEYGWRLKISGFETIRLGSVIMEHHLGDPPKGLNLFGKLRLVYLDHSPSRWYYITRNSLAVCHRYKDALPKETRAYLHKILKNALKMLLFGEDRICKIKMILRGMKDYRKFRFGELCG